MGFISPLRLTTVLYPHNRREVLVNIKKSWNSVIFASRRVGLWDANRGFRMDWQWAYRWLYAPKGIEEGTQGCESGLPAYQATRWSG